MQLPSLIAETGALLMLVGTLLQQGLAVSAAGKIAYDLQPWLATRTSYVEPPDPTASARTWRRFWDRLFHPFGLVTTSRSFTPTMNRIAYTVGAGLAVAVVALSAYVTLSSGVLGAALASYYVAGFVPPLAPVITQIAAVCAFGGVVAILYGPERAVEVVPSDSHTSVE